MSFEHFYWPFVCGVFIGWLFFGNKKEECNCEEYEEYEGIGD